MLNIGLNKDPDHQNNMEEYLREIHAQEYVGTDDDMTEAFEKWLSQLDVDNWLVYSDRYYDSRITK